MEINYNFFMKTIFQIQYLYFINLKILLSLTTFETMILNYHVVDHDKSFIDICLIATQNIFKFN